MKHTNDARICDSCAFFGMPCSWTWVDDLEKNKDLKQALIGDGKIFDDPTQSDEDDYGVVRIPPPGWATQHFG